MWVSNPVLAPTGVGLTSLTALEPLDAGQIRTSREKEPTQKVVMAFLFAACIALVVLPPLDVRFGWSSVPWYICIFGDALVVVSFYLFYLVSKVNTYAAAQISALKKADSDLDRINEKREQSSKSSLWHWLEKRSNKNLSIN